MNAIPGAERFKKYLNGTLLYDEKVALLVLDKQSNFICLLQKAFFDTSLRRQTFLGKTHVCNVIMCMHNDLCVQAYCDGVFG